MALVARGVVNARHGAAAVAMTHVPGGFQVDDGDWEGVLLDRWRAGQERSMVGPSDPAVHLDRARAMAAILDEPVAAIDLGSGAGIPGLALAGIWPRSRWVLIDSALRRVRHLQESVERLGWSDRVRVVHARAEEAGRDAALRGQADLVTARSFGRPAVTAECGAAFLRVGGILAVTEPPESAGERWPVEGLRALNLRPARLVAGIQCLELVAAVPEAFPRRPGLPAKRPLF